METERSVQTPHASYVRERLLPPQANAATMSKIRIPADALVVLMDPARSDCLDPVWFL